MGKPHYWTGTEWKPLCIDGAGGVGPQGPPGESVEVFGPQVAEPVPARKGDLWLVESVARDAYLQTPAAAVIPPSPDAVVPVEPAGPSPLDHVPPPAPLEVASARPPAPLEVASARPPALEVATITN
jgi:hypothetical protein